MRHIHALFALLAVFIFSLSAVAAVKTDVLRRNCREVEKADAGNAKYAEAMSCLSYISGFSDGLTISSAMPGNKRLICPPENGVSNGQLVAIFLKWADAHPEQWHEEAGFGVLISLRDAFPCPK